MNSRLSFWFPDKPGFMPEVYPPLEGLSASGGLIRLSALIRNYYDVFYSNGIIKIHRKAAENAEDLAFFVCR